MAKRMTVREKKYAAELRKELREAGLIPPLKTRLNRKKFVLETREEFKETGLYDLLPDLMDAFSWMLATAESTRKITSEEIGAAKVLRLAMDLHKFKQDKLAAGEETYKAMELYEKVIKPVKDL